MEPSPPPAAVSVVVSTLDRPVLLARCLGALLDGVRLPTEVVVVDQGGGDEVAALLEGCRRTSDVRFVHVVQRERGLSTSQNAGVRTASHAVVAVVDDDCVPDPRWVEVLEREHASAPGPLLITGRVLPLPAEGDRVVALSSRTSQERRLLPPDALPWDVGTGGNFSVTRSAYLQVGGNDVRLGTGTPGRAGNDLDLFRRLLRAGVTAKYEPDLLVLHERATVAEHVSRRWTYGFGAGACAALWRRQGDPDAARLLRAWTAMRLGRIRTAERPVAVAHELRVLAGTVHGLWYGWRTGRPGGPDRVSP